MFPIIIPFLFTLIRSLSASQPNLNFIGLDSSADDLEQQDYGFVILSPSSSFRNLADLPMASAPDCRDLELATHQDGTPVRRNVNNHEDSSDQTDEKTSMSETSQLLLEVAHHPRPPNPKTPSTTINRRISRFPDSLCSLIAVTFSCACGLCCFIQALLLNFLHICLSRQDNKK